MGMRVAAAVLGCGVVLAGCAAQDGGATDGEPLVGPGASLSEAQAAGSAQWDAVGRIGAAEGPTRWVELPRGGTGVYRGVLSGWAGAGPRLDHAGDLSLALDFGRQEVSGVLRNVVTGGVAGFRHPDGEIGLSGVLVRDDRGDARIVLGGTGVLEAPGSAAEVAVDGSGAVLGDRAQAIEGRHATDFAWTRGPLAGSVSRSDGVFTAVTE